MILTVPPYWKHSPKTHRTPSEPPKSPYPNRNYPRSIKDRLQRNKAAINAPKNDGVQRMVDREAKRAEGKGIGYDRWAAVHNLKQMAATMSIYEESGFASPEELEAARDGLKAQKTEKARKACREQHESDFIIADTAARYFREHGITKLPASKALQREIEQLTVQKNAGYNDYREKRQRAQELQTVRRNIDQILRGAPSQQKKREQER